MSAKKNRREEDAVKTERVSKETKLRKKQERYVQIDADLLARLLAAKA